MTTEVPSELIVGDTWQFSREFSDYPAGTWTAAIFFVSEVGSFSANGTTSGTGFAFTVAASTTAGYKAGRYQWRIRVSSGSTVYTAESGWIDIRPNPAATGKNDPRSWARRTLEAVEAFLEGNATTAQQSMSINGRSLSRWSLAELRQWRDQLRAEVRTEEAGERAGLGRNMKVRFSRV